MGDILVKVHDSYRMVVAICDSDLIGKVFNEGEKRLDLSGEFYKGKVMSNDEVVLEIERTVAEDATFNIVGPKSVDLAIRIGLAKKSGVKEIDGVPFALLLL